MPTSPTYQSNANPFQAQAIKHSAGPLLIIAGPGSGKTYTLVERIVYLISNHGIAPEKMLILVFV